MQPSVDTYLILETYLASLQRGTDETKSSNF